mgnify:CR=1 FL=1
MVEDDEDIVYRQTEVMPIEYCCPFNATVVGVDGFEVGGTRRVATIVGGKDNKGEIKNMRIDLLKETYRDSHGQVKSCRVIETPNEKNSNQSKDIVKGGLTKIFASPSSNCRIGSDESNKINH